jgi:hypothetical protein
MLGRGPSGGGRGTEYQGRTLEPSTASNRPDSSRLLLSVPPYPRRGAMFSSNAAQTTRQQSLLNIPSSEGWRGSAGVGSPGPPAKTGLHGVVAFSCQIPRSLGRIDQRCRFPPHLQPVSRVGEWGVQSITQFLPGFPLQHWNSLMPVNPPAPDVFVNTSVATASESLEARRGTDR